jgi:hypothetical protein
VYLSLPDDGHSDWPKHAARWNKSERVKVKVLCCMWICTAGDWFTQWDDIAQINIGNWTVWRWGVIKWQCSGDVSLKLVNWWTFEKGHTHTHTYTHTHTHTHTHKKRLGNLKAYPMYLQPSNVKGPHPFLWAGLQTACGKVTKRCTPNLLNYSGIFILHSKFTNLVADSIIGPGGPRIGDPWPTPSPQVGMQLAPLCSC